MPSSSKVPALPASAGLAAGAVAPSTAAIAAPVQALTPNDVAEMKSLREELQSQYRTLYKRCAEIVPAATLEALLADAAPASAGGSAAGGGKEGSSADVMAGLSPEAYLVVYRLQYVRGQLSEHENDMKALGLIA